MNIFENELLRIILVDSTSILEDMDMYHTFLYITINRRRPEKTTVFLMLSAPLPLFHHQNNALRRPNTKYTLMAAEIL